MIDTKNNGTTARLPVHHGARNIDISKVLERSKTLQHTYVPVELDRPLRNTPVDYDLGNKRNANEPVKDLNRLAVFISFKSYVSFSVRETVPVPL